MTFTEVQALSPGIIFLSSSSDLLVLPNRCTVMWILIVLKKMLI